MATEQDMRNLIQQVGTETDSQTAKIASIISALSNKAYSCAYSEAEVREAITALESM